MKNGLYTAHEVAVILADAFGDDCACNFNGNDEWLPYLCELQADCPHPCGVACWEQYLKYRHCKNEMRQRKMKFKDFEIRPTCFLDGHTDPKKWDVVKWYKTDKPGKVTDAKTGEEKMQDTFCYSVAQIWWNDKEPCWEFKSIGTRFLEDYEAGLCEFILKWLELTDLTRKFT